MELDPLLRRLHSPAVRGTYSKYISELFKSSYVYHIMCVGGGERAREGIVEKAIFLFRFIFFLQKSTKILIVSITLFQLFFHSVIVPLLESAMVA